MKNVVRIALPGYDVFTDTNLDHFSLYTDEDNILIKEFTRNTVTVGAGVDQTISHNLGYVPLFMVFVQDLAGAGKWSLVGIGNILSAQVVASADTSNLVISNLTAGSLTFKYFIFYDNQVGSSSISITESNHVFKIAKQGIDAKSSKDPNDYIFHSDLNSFKIVYQGKTTINVSSATSNYSFNHNSPLSSTSAILVFAQFPDGKVTQTSWYGSPSDSCKSYDNLQGTTGHSFDQMYFDSTKIYFRNAGVVTAYDIVFVWYVFEASI